MAFNHLRTARFLAVTGCLLGIHLPAVVHAACADSCPACTTGVEPVTGRSVTFCGQRDLCLAGCVAEDALAAARSQALQRLDADGQAALQHVQHSIDDQQQDVNARVASARQAFVDDVAARTATVQASAAAVLAGGRKALADLPGQLAQLPACAGAPLAKVLTATYDSVQAAGKSWQQKAIRDAAVASAQVRQAQAAAAAAEDARLAMAIARVSALDAASAPLQDVRDRMSALKAQVQGSGDLASLRSWASEGFPDLDRLAQDGSAQASTDGDDARAQLQALARSEADRVNQAAADLEGAASRSVPARLQDFLQDRVPSLANLGRALWHDPGWPKAWTCLCQRVDLIPDPGGTAARHGYVDNFQRLTDGTCALAAAVAHDPKVARAFEQISAGPAGPVPAPAPVKPIPHLASLEVLTTRDAPGALALVVDPFVNAFLDTGFHPATARSAASRAALLRKADDYAAWTRDLHTTSEGLVVPCARTQNHAHASPLRACSQPNHALANTGLYTSKLLAAQVYRYGQLADSLPPAQRLVALADIRQSLATVHALMTMAGLQPCPPGAGVQDHCGTILRRDGSPSPAQIHPIRGLPVRGFVRLASCEPAHCDPALGMPDSAWGRFFLDDDAMAAAGEADRGPDGRPGPQDHNHRFVGCLYQIGCGVYFFEERGSGDDTFATLLAVTAAYELFKSRNLEPQWRERLVTAAEDFGQLYQRAGLWFSYLDGQQWEQDPRHGTPAERLQADEDPQMLIQRLAWLKAVIFLSTDQRGNADRVDPLLADYDRLSRALFLPGTVMNWFEALLRNPATHTLAHVATRYTIQPFTAEFSALGLYLLTRYERDDALRLRYRGIYTHVVLPMTSWVHLPLYDYIMLHVVGNDPSLVQATRLDWEGAKDAIAAVLVQYRDPPEPFGNPDPGSPDPEDESFYYTDYRDRHELYDPLHLAFCAGNRKKPCATEAPSRHPLGPGLAPNFMGLNYLLMGGDVVDGDAHASTFDPDEFGPARLTLPNGNAVTPPPDGSELALGPAVSVSQARDGHLTIAFRVVQPRGPDQPEQHISVPPGDQPTSILVPGYGTVRVMPAPILHTVRVPVQVNFLLAYWFARAHQLLEP